MKIIGKLLNELFLKNPEAAKPQKQDQQPEKQSKNPQPKTTDNCDDVTIKHHRVTSVSHYTDNLLTLAKENPDYSLKKSELIKRKMYNEYIYQYQFSSGKAALIPEPTNEYDPNAVQVLIGGKHVGYIKSGSCKHILNLINENRIEKVEAKIKGGKYRCLCCYGDDEKEDCEMEIGSDPYSIKLSIYERSES